MSWRVLSIGYPFAAAGTDSVGGAEQILVHLDLALAEAGHESLVVAPAGSRTQGKLIETPPVQDEITTEVQAVTYSRVCEIVTRAVDRFDPDLVHMHGIDFYRYMPADDRPVLVTLHLPISFYPSFIFELPRTRTYFVCVSRSQSRTCPKCDYVLAPIENGVPLPFERLVPKRNHTICLSRIAPEKNCHVALEAARDAGVPCLLAGKVFGYPEHREYFAKSVEPLLDGERRFLGPLDEPAKWRLLSSARCLLQPSLAQETSSLVAMEALACGTPVIAFPSGALPEIVENGKTGFIVRSKREMAQAISWADRIGPQVCLATARKRFSVDRMTRDYIDLYGKLTRTSSQSGLLTVETY